MVYTLWLCKTETFLLSRYSFYSNCNVIKIYISFFVCFSIKHTAIVSSFVKHFGRKKWSLSERTFSMALVKKKAEPRHNWQPSWPIGFLKFTGTGRSEVTVLCWFPERRKRGLDVWIHMNNLLSAIFFHLSCIQLKVKLDGLYIPDVLLFILHGVAD